MRGHQAEKSADRISRTVILLAGVSCGAVAFTIGLPLAQSSPYPTSSDTSWTASVLPSFQLASITPTASPVEPPAPPAIEKQAAIEWDALTAPTLARESLVLMAKAIPEPVWDTEPNAPVSAAALAPRMQLASIAPTATPVNLPTLKPAATNASPKRNVGPMTEVDDYLWEVYQREPTKKDSTGDFTWKDPAAAKRIGKTLPDYVVGGMHRDFREQLYHAGKAMDDAGVKWSMLSAFRDDYRQGIATGFKARTGNSLHGGSRATGGYGNGRAADVVAADGDHRAVWRWIDRHGAKYGLRRPMPGADPAHIQAGGAWHNVAVALRDQRSKVANASTPTKEASAAKSKVTGNGDKTRTE
jgi:hypothetical protein